MLGVIVATWLARRSAYAQDQAYCPCEQETKLCEGCSQTSQGVVSYSLDSRARKSADQPRLNRP